LLSITRSRMQQPRWQLKKNGAVVVRKFLTGAETAELQSVVRAIYEAMAEIGTFVDADMENHFRRWNGVWLEHLPSLLEATIAISLPDTDGWSNLSSVGPRGFSATAGTSLHCDLSCRG
jgi:hypothetical protein